MYSCNGRKALPPILHSHKPVDLVVRAASAMARGARATPAHTSSPTSPMPSRPTPGACPWRQRPEAALCRVARSNCAGRQVAGQRHPGALHRPGQCRRRAGATCVVRHTGSTAAGECARATRLTETCALLPPKVIVCGPPRCSETSTCLAWGFEGCGSRSIALVRASGCAALLRRCLPRLPHRRYPLTWPAAPPLDKRAGRHVQGRGPSVY